MEETQPASSGREGGRQSTIALSVAEPKGGRINGTTAVPREREILREEVRKLAALCQISHLLQTEDGDGAALLPQIAAIVQAALASQGVAGVRLSYHELEAMAGHFADTQTTRSAAFLTRNGTRGTIEIAYEQRSPKGGQAGFPGGGEHLLNALAESLRAYFDRQQTEWAVKQQSEIIDQIHDSVVSTDLQGKVLTWNTGAERLFGYTAAEAAGRHISFVYDPKQHEFLQQAVIAPLRAKGTHEAEVWMRRKSGEAFCAHLRLSLLRDSRGVVTGMIGYSMDITARKQAEESLQARSRQQAALAELGQSALAGKALNSLLEQAVVLVATNLGVEYSKILELLPGGKAFRLRAGVGWRKGHVGRANVGAGRNSQAGYTLLSRSPVIVKDLRTDRRFRGPPLLRAHGVVSGMSVAIGGLAKPFGVLGAHTRQGREFTLDDISFLQGVAHVLAQAIERQETRAALEERELAFRTLTENLPGVVFRVSPGEHPHIVFFSKAAEKILGYAPEELGTGEFCPVESVVIEEDRAAFRETLRRALMEMKPFAVEYRIRHKDGQVRFMLEHGTPIAGPDGKLRHIDGVILDQTERKRLESLVLEISEREQRRVGQDLHDSLSQHLRGIVYLSHALEQKLEASFPSQAKSAARISRLVDEAIVQARALARGLAPLSLEADGLTHALEELASSAGSLYGIKCRFQCPHRVLVHNPSKAIHLYRIAQEALQNALRHAKAGRITIRLRQKRDHIILGIADNGVGLPAHAARSGGMGLKIMSYRAGIIGAALKVKRARGGTVVTCTLRSGNLPEARNTKC